MATYNVSTVEDLVLAASAAGAGDTVLVAAGAYVLAASLPVAATFQGAGRGQTILSREINDSDSVIGLMDGGSLEDCTVNGTGTGEVYGILEDIAGGTMAIRRVDVNSTTDGIGFTLGEVTATLEHVSVTTDWQAMLISAAGTVTCTRCAFNVADGPGSAAASALTAITVAGDAGTVTLANCIADAASETLPARGIVVTAGTTTAADCSFSGLGYVDAVLTRTDTAVSAPGTLTQTRSTGMAIIIPKLRRLPKTGQTTVHVAGDDGTYQAGWRDAPRFVAAGVNCVIDRQTGLMWPANIEGVVPFNAAFADWATAIAACEACTVGGYTDWRLPNMLEFLSIVNCEPASGPAVWSSVKTTATRSYWTATTRKTTTTQAMAAYVGTEYASVGPIAKTTNTYYAIPVRSAIYG